MDYRTRKTRVTSIHPKTHVSLSFFAVQIANDRWKNDLQRKMNSFQLHCHLYYMTGLGLFDAVTGHYPKLFLFLFHTHQRQQTYKQSHLVQTSIYPIYIKIVFAIFIYTVYTTSDLYIGRKSNKSSGCWMRCVSSVLIWLVSCEHL